MSRLAENYFRFLLPGLLAFMGVLIPRMLECALYGIRKENFEWKGEIYKQLEVVYTRKNQRIVIQSRLCPNAFSALTSGELLSPTLDTNCIQGCGCEHTLLSRSSPDPNRHRASIVTKISKAKLAAGLNPDEYFSCLGFTRHKSRLIEGVLYRRLEYSIDSTRVIAGYSEEEKEEKNLEVGKKYFLVKVYVEDKEPEIGEEILNRACVDLEDDVLITKPDLDNFEVKINTGFVGYEVENKFRK